MTQNQAPTILDAGACSAAWPAASRPGPGPGGLRRRVESAEQPDQQRAGSAGARRVRGGRLRRFPRKPDHRRNLCRRPERRRRHRHHQTEHRLARGLLQGRPGRLGGRRSGLQRQPAAVREQGRHRGLRRRHRQGPARPSCPAAWPCWTPSKAEDKDAMVVTKATAREVPAEVHRGPGQGLRQHRHRRPGRRSPSAPTACPGLKKNYNCVPKKLEPDQRRRRPADAQGAAHDQVQVADIYTTTPSIADNDLVVLEDPKNNFIAQQVLPLIQHGQDDGQGQGQP